MIITQKHEYVSNRRYKFVIDPHTNEAVGVETTYIKELSSKAPPYEYVWMAPENGRIDEGMTNNLGTGKQKSKVGRLDATCTFIKPSTPVPAFEMEGLKV
jgi:hypothetical protein